MKKKKSVKIKMVINCQDLSRSNLGFRHNLSVRPTSQSPPRESAQQLFTIICMTVTVLLISCELHFS